MKILEQVRKKLEEIRYLEDLIITLRGFKKPLSLEESFNWQRKFKNWTESYNKAEAELSLKKEELNRLEILVSLNYV